jgi:hypothetical protein
MAEPLRSRDSRMTVIGGKARYILSFLRASLTSFGVWITCSP